VATGLNRAYCELIGEEPHNHSAGRGSSIGRLTGGGACSFCGPLHLQTHVWEATGENILNRAAKSMDKVCDIVSQALLILGRGRHQARAQHQVQV
jgi:hypothetical protein